MRAPHGARDARRHITIAVVEASRRAGERIARSPAAAAYGDESARYRGTPARPRSPVVPRPVVAAGARREVAGAGPGRAGGRATTYKIKKKNKTPDALCTLWAGPTLTRRVPY